MFLLDVQSFVLKFSLMLTVAKQNLLSHAVNRLIFETANERITNIACADFGYRRISRNEWHSRVESVPRLHMLHCSSESHTISN